MKSWVVAAIIGSAALVLAAVSLWARSQLVALTPLGYDEFWGFLFSPIPFLRLVAVLQLAGTLCVVAGALLYWRWIRDHNGVA